MEARMFRVPFKNKKERRIIMMMYLVGGLVGGLTAGIVVLASKPVSRVVTSMCMSGVDIGVEVMRKAKAKRELKRKRRFYINRGAPVCNRRNFWGDAMSYCLPEDLTDYDLERLP